MPDTISVLLTSYKPLPTDDGALCSCMIQDQATGASGTIIISTARLRELLGDCPTSDLVNIDPSEIAWLQ